MLKTDAIDPSDTADATPVKMDIRWFLAICGCLLIASLWLYSYFLLSEAKQEAVAEARKDATNTAHSLTNFTHHVFEATDQLTLILREQFLTKDGAFEMAAFLHDSKLLTLPNTTLMVTDANGVLLSSNMPQPSPNLHQLEAVQYHLNHDSKDVYISRPLKAGKSDRWEIQLSRKAVDKSGVFRGIVLATIDLRNFNQFYDQLHLNQNDSLTLIGADGIIRARKSGINTDAGLDVTRGNLYPIIRREQNGIVTATSSVDGRVRHYAFQKVADYPLFAALGIDADDSLKPYEKRKRRTWELTAFATLMALLANIVIHSLIGRLLDSRQQAVSATQAQQQLLSNVEQQRAELVDHAEHLRAIWNNTADAMLTTNHAYLIQNVNPTAKRLFASDQLIGQDLQKLIPNLPSLDRALSVPHGDNPAQIEVQCQRPDGSQFPAELGLAHFHHGAELNMIVSLHDLTERQRVEQMKTSFVAAVSGELRAPLAIIRSHLQTVIDTHHAELPGPARMLLANAREHGERLNALVNDLLDVHELEVGMMHFAILRTPLLPLLHKTMAHMQGLAERHGVRLELISGIPECMMQIDPDRFEQALGNLISNACKFSPKGATVTLQTHLLPSDRVRVSVIDRGIGIAESMRPQLFGKFVQAQGQPTGTGLGLNLCKAIVEHMHGTVGYQSVEGRGSTFYIELPAQPD